VPPQAYEYLINFSSTYWNYTVQIQFVIVIAVTSIVNIFTL